MFMLLTATKIEQKINYTLHTHQICTITLKTGKTNSQSVTL